MCLIIIYLHLYSHEKTQEIYLEQTEAAIIDIKKDFLKDTVNNISVEIDKLRESKYANYEKNIDSRYRRFQDELYLADEEFVKIFIDRFNEDLHTDMWTAFLWNEKTGEVLYNSSETKFESIEKAEENFKKELTSYALVGKGDIQGAFGVSKLYIDEIVKKEMGNLIRMRSFSNGSYIWINEIINFAGGKDYAIRKVHPNLIDEEGSYLSTDMKDAEGDFPYLEELNGINEAGEVFSSYYFKELNSSKISKKITYAKLYEDYNWVIAMGVHLDAIDVYTQKINSEIDSLSSESIIRLLGLILVILLIGFSILYLIDKKHVLNSTKILEKEINLDSLTKAASRRSGELNLSGSFKQFISTGKKTAIMMFDIDNFKDVNDKYGHEIGDLVLVEVVRSINHTIRTSDQFIRWGGDEFVGIFPDLKEEEVLSVGVKLLDAISSLEIPVENEVISVTISVGFSFFKDSDSDYNDVLKRVDDAMYKSKLQGKNKVNIV